MLWRTDASGAFTHFTRRWTDFTGRAEDKECGSGWLDGVHPTDRPAFNDAFDLALAERREFRIDQRLRHCSGVYRWVRHHGIPDEDAAGKFAGYLGSTFEIGDLVEARDELAREVERLEAANKDLEELAHSGSHDLREPLRNLEYLLSRLLEEGLGAAAVALVHQSRAQVGRLSELAGGLVRFARSGAGDLDPDPTDARKAVEWALTNLSERVGQPDTHIDVRPLPSVMADPLQLARVFQNLLDNALRFRRPGPLAIEVGGQRRGSEVLLWVRDTGVGIAAEHHEAIFHVFQRLHGDEIPGTGIGLAVCRRVVARHGGRIWVESELGRGATFSFTLPAAD